MAFYIFASTLISFCLGGIICGGIGYNSGVSDERQARLNEAEKRADEHGKQNPKV